VHVNGALSLQTSAVLSFASQEGALLALRMAGMRGSLPVPLTGADGTTRQPVGTAWLQAPQYACRLRFQRLTCLEDAAAVAPSEPAAGGVEGAAPAGLAAAHDDAGESAEVLPVDQVWHSGSAVLSAAEPSPEERLLLATAWSRAGYRKKLLAHGATLLPAKPAGAAQLLALTFSRHVRLLAPPADAAPAAGGAIAAQVADGERAVAFALPWLLRRADLDAINELRAALSGSVGERPAADGEPAAAIQLRLMKLLVEKRPQLSEGLAAMAAAIAADAPNLNCGEWPSTLLPPIGEPAGASGVLAELAAGGGAEPMEEEEAAWGGAHGGGAAHDEAGGVDGAASDEEDLELLEI